MCLAVPAKVLETYEDETARVDIGGASTTVSTVLLEKVSPGDYVLVHVGFALNRIDPDEAHETLALFAELDNVLARPMET
jgi:hydrogenase expression/formation protein HypC